MRCAQENSDIEPQTSRSRAAVAAWEGVATGQFRTIEQFSRRYSAGLRGHKRERSAAEGRAAWLVEVDDIMEWWGDL